MTILIASGSVALADTGYAAKAFAEICLGTAPSFKAVPAKAAKYGGSKFMSLGELNISSNAKKDITIQYKAGKECVITTSKDNSARKKLLKTLKGQFGIKQIPAHVKRGSKTFLIAHKRQGGETFILIKQ